MNGGFASSLGGEYAPVTFGMTNAQQNTPCFLLAKGEDHTEIDALESSFVKDDLEPVR